MKKTNRFVCTLMGTAIHACSVYPYLYPSMAGKASRAGNGAIISNIILD
ncbi:MAG: hypothetical protein AABW85_03825 [archaeon]